MVYDHKRNTPHKRGLMGEFMMCWDKEGRNMSAVRQINNEMIEVYIKQYPDLETPQKITIFEELNRLRYMGWQLRYLEFDADQDLHLYFDKVDWRSREYYGLIETKYNNQKDIWWLGKTPIATLRKRYPLERIVDPAERVKPKSRRKPKKRRR